MLYYIKYCWLLRLFIVISVLSSSFSILADTNMFIINDNPYVVKKNMIANYKANFNAQSGNSRNSNLSASGSATLFKKTNAYSTWGCVSNNSSDDQRRLEKYQLGVRGRHNLDNQHFLFMQVNWLNDRYNGYRFQNILITGCGFQAFQGPVHTLKLEFGPSLFYNKYFNGGNKTKIQAYGSTFYSYQITKNTQFIQNILLFASNNIIMQSETGINIDLNDHFTLKIAYNFIWNGSPIKRTLKHTDVKTSFSLAYKI